MKGTTVIRRNCVMFYINPFVPLLSCYIYTVYAYTHPKGVGLKERKKEVYFLCAVKQTWCRNFKGVWTEIGKSNWGTSVKIRVNHRHMNEKMWENVDRENFLQTVVVVSRAKNLSQIELRFFIFQFNPSRTLKVNKLLKEHNRICLVSSTATKIF